MDDDRKPEPNNHDNDEGVNHTLQVEVSSSDQASKESEPKEIEGMNIEGKTEPYDEEDENVEGTAYARATGVRKVKKDIEEQDDKEKVERLKYKIYQYEYTIKAQQEQLKHYHELVDKMQIMQAQTHALKKHNEKLTNGIETVSSLENDAYTTDDNEEEELTDSEQYELLVNEVLRLNLELAEARTTADWQDLQIRETIAERDSLQREIDSHKRNNTSEKKSMLEKLGESSNRIFRFDEKHGAGNPKK